MLATLRQLRCPTSLKWDGLRTEVGWKCSFFFQLLDSRAASLSTWASLGYMPATSAAFTTAQFSEFTFTSRMSLAP